MEINNKIRLVCLGSFLAIGVANASTHCNGFEIKVKNNLPYGLLVSKVQLIGGDIQPGNISKINEHSETVFTVNNSSKKMNAELVFNTIALPSKQVRVRFDLSNALLSCKHDDKTVKESDVSVNVSRSIGKVTYTLG